MSVGSGRKLRVYLRSLTWLKQCPEHVFGVRALARDERAEVSLSEERNTFVRIWKLAVNPGYSRSIHL